MHDSLHTDILLRRVKVVGHDFGAALAWGLALALPERVEKLCVISVGHMGRILHAHSDCTPLDL